MNKLVFSPVQKATLGTSRARQKVPLGLHWQGDVVFRNRPQASLEAWQAEPRATLKKLVSRMRSEGFSFYTLGVWGLRCVRWMPLLCPQPSATVCNRLQPFATVCKRTFGRKLAVPIGSFTGVVIFGRFTCLRPSFRVAGVALRDMWTCLATC